MKSTINAKDNGIYSNHHASKLLLDKYQNCICRIREEDSRIIKTPLELVSK
jgi:hypothetical protein